MNWSKALIAGVAGGIALNIVDFVMHGIIMTDVYSRYTDVFAQEQANPLFFLLVAVCLAIAAALLFSKTRACWAHGPKGGTIFGIFLGIFIFFPGFYNPLVIGGFPYYLAWCWGGINFIGMVVLGTVLGLIIKRS